MLNREPLEPRLRRYLAERDAERPPVGLEVRIMKTIREQPARLPAASLPRQLLVAAVIAALALGVAGAIAYFRHQSAPVPAGRQTGLTPAEQAELAALEARPLIIPPMPADGHCPVGPLSNVSPFASTSVTLSLYGSGPVYGEGKGPAFFSPKADYFHVRAYTDATVRGVVLIRGQELGGRLQIVWVGPYAAGPVVGSDTIAGQQSDLHAELALPTARPPANTSAGPGWAIWDARDGVAKGASGCYGYQVDTIFGTEVFVVG